MLDALADGRFYINKINNKNGKILLVVIKMRIGVVGRRERRGNTERPAIPGLWSETTTRDGVANVCKQSPHRPIMLPAPERPVQTLMCRSVVQHWYWYCDNPITRGRG